MRSIQWLSLFALAAAGLAGQAQAPQAGKEDARVFKIFTDRVEQYLKLRKNVADAFIRPEVMGSDHCPVGIVLSR